MMKINRIFNVVFLLLAIIFSAIPQCWSTLSDKRLCYDPDCSEPISKARTIISYTPSEDGFLTFDTNIEVIVYSKEAGTRKDLWGIEVDGKRGYVSKTFLRESKVYHKDLKYEVPIESTFQIYNKSNKKLQSNKVTDKLKPVTKNVEASGVPTTVDVKSTEKLPNNAVPLYEVIDGTTIHVNPTKSSTEQTLATKVIQPAIVPNKENTVGDVKVESNSENVTTNIFATEEKGKGKEKNGGQNTSQNDNTDEKVSSLMQIIGRKLPSAVINNNLISNFFNTGNEAVGEIEKETAVEGDNVESSKEQAVSMVQNVNPSREESVSELQGLQLPIDQSNSKKEDEKIPKEQVPPVPDEKISKEPPVSELQGVQSLLDQSNPKKQDETVPGEQVPSVPDEKISKEQAVSEKQDAKTPKEPSVSKLQGVQSPIDQSNPKKQDETVPGEQVPSAPVEKISKEQAVFEKQDANTPKEPSVSELQGVQLPIDQSNPKKQDETVPGEQVPSAPVEMISKEQAGSEKQDVKTPKEQSVHDGQEVKLEEQSAGKLQDNHILNGTVENATVTLLNKVGTTASLYTISANNFEIDTKVAFNATEPSNKENIHAVENTQLETEETKLVENSNISETFNVEDGGKQSFNVILNSTSQESSSNYILENTSQTIITPGNEEKSEEVSKNVEAVIEFGNFDHSNEVTNATESGKIDTNEQVTNSDDSSDSAKFDLHPPEFMYAKEGIASENVASINEFRNRNLLNADTGEHSEIESTKIEETEHSKREHLFERNDDTMSVEEITSEDNEHKIEASSEVCTADNVECSTEVESQNTFTNDDETLVKMENFIESIGIVSNYWMTFMYLIITATATLIFSLGYYYIENMRRDGQLIAKINKLEKDLLVSTKESTMLKENLKVTKDKLNCIEDESFGSNEMVLSLKADLEASQNAKAELEDQVSMLEKDLESATEAGLELERMLREVLSSDNEVNPLAQSVEDLQTRLNAQQTANESLTSALNLKTQENESLSTELAFYKKKHEELEVELIRLTENCKLEVDSKNNIHKTLTDKVQELEIQIKDISNEKVALQKELKCKEMETKDLMDVINRLNSNLDLDKLYNVTHIKAEAKGLLDERNELKIRLTEVEGAHNLLEEHMKVIKEEVSTLSEQCKAAEKEKKDAETRLEVLSNFFKEKEAQRQKEESIWLQQQGEVVSTVERIQTMQSEIQNYKQQIEMLKREILDQEREYENQISIIEKNAHEQWIKARQVERRLEESKVEAGQLRNRLTLIEKNINDVDPEVKLHRMEANGETATSPPLFIGAESSSSPIMFSGSSNVPPPPPPSYLHSLFPPYLPLPLPNSSNVPPYEISQRPPPLGGRLSSPPPMPLHPPNSSRYDNAGSPPPMSPHLLPSFPNLRIPPPSFGNDHFPGPPPPQFVNDHYPGPPPPLGSIMPAHLGTTHSWGEEPLTPLRNSGFHLSQRERVQNHKGRKRFSKVRQFWSTLEGNNCK
ncbi:transport and golgi organization 1 isoform X2 [Augochlora pura]